MSTQALSQAYQTVEATLQARYAALAEPGADVQALYREIAALTMTAQRLTSLIQQEKYRQTYSFNLRFPETD